ncbi:MAG: 3-keto-5-aminohexanoate cleavage protein [Novosphingobium sp.]|nr:3-keto-5-aminohexanoate cleavage protein [Novosphingobium sp.]
MTEHPLVIAVSINGEKSKAENPNVPREPDEIVACALACYDAGATVIHAHNRDTALLGREAAEDYLLSWRRICAARPGAIWYPTITRAGGGDLEHVRLIDEAIGLQFAVVDPGAVAIGRFDGDGLPAGGYYINAFDQIRSAFAQLEAWGIGAQISVYEPGYLRMALAWHAAGRLPRGSVVNFYFGGAHGPFGREPSLPFGLPPTRAALDAYLDLLGDAGLPWTVSVWGGDVLATELPRLAIERGGHVQVGLESHWDAVERPSNEDQVRAVVELARAAGRPVADRDAALEALGRAAPSIA